MKWASRLSGGLISRRERLDVPSLPLSSLDTAAETSGMEFDVGVLTRLECEFEKQQTKLKQLAKIGRTLGAVQQPAPPGLLRALQDFATELRRHPKLANWLNAQGQADRSKWEQQIEERKQARQRAKTQPKVADPIINEILAEKGIPKSRRDFDYLESLLTGELSDCLGNPVAGLELIEPAVRAVGKLRQRLRAVRKAAQRRNEQTSWAKAVQTAIEAAGQPGAASRDTTPAQNAGAAVDDGGNAGSRMNVSADLEKRVASLESQTTKPPKPLTKTERIRNQRIKFCCPKRRKKSPDTWNEIYHAYNKKFPNDKTASPDTLLHSHDRNCLKCREQKS